MVLTTAPETQTINAVPEFNSFGSIPLGSIPVLLVRGGAVSSVQVTIVVQIRAHFLFGNLIALLLSLTLFLLSFCDSKEKKE